MRLEGGVAELGLVAREREQGQLAELEGLRWGESGQLGRGGQVGGVEVAAEDLEVGVPGNELGVGMDSERSDVGLGEQLGEDVGVRSGGRAADQVSGCAGGGGGFA